MRERKIWVIGSKEHKLASKCTSWQEFIKMKEEEIYFGDYLYVIINLQSLNRELLKEFEISKKFEIIKREIVKSLLGNTTIICISAPLLTMGNITNYLWYPGGEIAVENKKGESIDKIEDNISGLSLSSYFKYVKKWNHYFIIKKEFYYLWNTLHRLQLSQEFLEKLPKKLIRELLKTPTRHLIAFGIKPLQIIFEQFSNLIIFLPPTTECTVEEGINILIKELLDIKSMPLPSWVDNILIYGEKELKDEIEECEKNIKTFQQKVEEAKNKLEGLTKYKRLLVADGEELEEIVKDSFNLLGIEVEKGPKAKEDMVIIDPETKSKIPVEITGVTGSIPETKLNQLIGRLTDEERLKEIKCECKGVLIGNHYKNKELDENLKGRDKPFESEVIKKAIISKISLLSTIELFKAINAKLEGKKVSNFIRAIFNTSGEVLFRSDDEVMD